MKDGENLNIEEEQTKNTFQGFEGPIELNIEGDSFFESEIIHGRIIFNPKEFGNVTSIIISLKKIESFYFLIKNKTLNQNSENKIYSKEINKKKLQLVNHAYNFEVNLPSNLTPSFEFFENKNTCYIRYILSVIVKDVNFEKTKTILIKSRPNIDKNFINEKKCKVNLMKLFSKGNTMIKVFNSDNNNFILGNENEISIEIDNKECKENISSLKLVLQRIITIYDNGKEYNFNYILYKEKFPVNIKSGQEVTLNYNIQLKKFVFNKSYNFPFTDYDDLNYFLPSIKTKLIFCHYIMKVSTKYSSFFVKNKLKIEIPIFFTHQSFNEYQNQINGLI